MMVHHSTITCLSLNYARKHYIALCRNMHTSQSDLMSDAYFLVCTFIICILNCWEEHEIILALSGFSNVFSLSFKKCAHKNWVYLCVGIGRVAPLAYTIRFDPLPPIHNPFMFSRGKMIRTFVNDNLKSHQTILFLCCLL